VWRANLRGSKPGSVGFVGAGGIRQRTKYQPAETNPVSAQWLLKEDPRLDTVFFGLKKCMFLGAISTFLK
jgi:hypothetical protein